jgi:hypothetical protein
LRRAPGELYVNRAAASVYAREPRRAAGFPFNDVNREPATPLRVPIGLRRGVADRFVRSGMFDRRRSSKTNVQKEVNAAVT